MLRISNKSWKLSSFNNCLLLVMCFLLTAGCTSGKTEPDPKRENYDYYFVGQPAKPPAGVVRYCWEEPLVEYQAREPGLKDGGRWYHPSALIVRQLRAGRWRPCEPLLDESKGETKNER